MQGRLRPHPRALAHGPLRAGELAPAIDEPACSNLFAIVLFAAFAYPAARLLSGALVYICVAVILFGLPFAMTFVDRVRFFTVSFLVLAIGLEASTAVVHQMTTANSEFVKYSFIGLLLWLLMLLGNCGANHEGKNRLDYLVIGPTLVYLAVFALIRRGDVCPVGQICVEQLAQYTPREQSIFEHPNELGLFVAGLFSFNAWVFWKKHFRQQLFGLLVGAGLVYFLIKSGSATSAVAAVGVVAACYLERARVMINLGIVALIALLFVAQIFFPTVGMEISGYQGSFWWRFVVADEVGRQLGSVAMPLRYDLFSVFNTWLHSKYLDIYVIFGMAGVGLFAAFAVLAVISAAQLLSTTVLGTIIISSLVQPFGAFPGPFLLWSLLYIVILSSELRDAAVHRTAVTDARRSERPNGAAEIGANTPGIARTA